VADRPDNSGEVSEGMTAIATLASVVPPRAKPPGSRPQPRAAALGPLTPIRDSLRLAQRPADDVFDLEQLAVANEEAAVTLWDALKVMARSPWQTVKGFGQMLIEPFVHPTRGLDRIKNAFKNEGPLEGALYTALYASTAATTASFVVMGTALLLAPFTGGASLAVAAAASQVMIWTGFHDAAVCTAILVKDEYDVATASSPEKYERNVGQLSDDFLNTFFAWVTLPWTDGQTALSSVPQGMALAGRSALKRPASLLARRGLRAFRSVSNVPRQQESETSQAH